MKLPGALQCCVCFLKLIRCNIEFWCIYFLKVRTYLQYAQGALIKVIIGFSICVCVARKFLSFVGVYKPRVRCYDLNNLGMKFERCFDSEVVKFLSLSDDYSKVMSVDNGLILIANGTINLLQFEFLQSIDVKCFWNFKKTKNMISLITKPNYGILLKWSTRKIQHF